MSSSFNLYLDNLSVSAISRTCRIFTKLQYALPVLLTVLEFHPIGMGTWEMEPELTLLLNSVTWLHHNNQALFSLRPHLIEAFKDLSNPRRGMSKHLL
jgi:hypothetical protein